MSIEFIFRIVGLLVFAIIGGYYGGVAGRIADQSARADQFGGRI